MEDHRELDVAVRMEEHSKVKSSPCIRGEYLRRRNRGDGAEKKLY